MTRNWTKVFSFTFARQTESRGYRVTTLLVALLLLIGIPVAMVLADSAKNEKPASTAITVAIATDDADFSVLSAIDASIYAGIEYRYAATPEDALALCEGNPNAVAITQADGAITVLLPDNTNIQESDAAAYGEFLAAYYPYLTAAQNPDLAKPAYARSTISATPEDGSETARTVLSMVLPYVSMMLLYFLVLAYGQDVANNVVMEKTSMLMDQFLVSVKPSAMILGKTLAIALTGILQLLTWIAAIWGGCALGVFAVRALNPGTTLGIIGVFDTLGSVSGMFTTGGVLVAIGITVAGFLLYCALSGIGGAMAGKPEDLSTTNMLFSLIIAASFLACLLTGETTGMVSTEAWLQFVPFTAILVVPGRVLLGEIPLQEGAISLAIVVVFALLLTLVAGKVYTMMAFYRGNPPTPARMLKMLRSGGRSQR